MQTQMQYQRKHKQGDSRLEQYRNRFGNATQRHKRNPGLVMKDSHLRQVEIEITDNMS